MATYAIGDLQGCLKPLRELLALVGFSTRRDRLWFVGDLVNRGPESLATLRFVRDLGDTAVTVLGNHDLHLLAVMAGHARLRKGDTLEDILAAPDRDDLLDWLRNRRLLHRDGGYAMVHAGLLPQWDIDQAEALAAEVERTLRADDWRDFVAQMYGNRPDCWDDGLRGWDRLRVIVNAMTRLRVCDEKGRMEFSYKGDPADSPAGYRPWFEIPGRRSADTAVICGHWSALGLKITPNLLALDSGCLWGRQLSAVRLEDRRTFQVACPKSAG
jgi:bis(5'-nucleosyl)-tetraphosphatase (symmetrical)